ncbi:MAG: glutamate--cysteine ligase, partial [Cellvibrionaceae bacterium]|nr:glutamate--cysteine ligase [Cellvibrionaceae bacterium]
MSLDQTLLSALNNKANRPLITGILRGIEKESLRIQPDGQLAMSPHPQALGAAMTHPQITTDFSEALLEFITAPSHRLDEVLGQLQQQHRFTVSQLKNELLWATSMPCMLGSNDEVPVAHYGNSNVGRMKTYYRYGLGHRYGRKMQTIAGIHYNFSLPSAFWAMLHSQENSSLDLQQYKTERYFDLIRNFRRYFWLLLYLFGASPAVCRSFVNGQAHHLSPFNGDQHSLHARYGTSLRMGDLGYQSNAQKSLTVCYNELDNYLHTLTEAINTPYEPYRAYGTVDSEGDYQQLTTSLLQIENEFYSTIRPKRTARSGETALGALHQRGVEYIEVRCLDINPYSPIGISAEQVHFIDTFLLYCLLKDSPKTNCDEYERMQKNQELTVYRGRDPEMKLLCAEGERSIADWGSELISEMAPLAELLDQAYKIEGHSQALVDQLEVVNKPELTPSGRILQGMKQQGKSFYQYAMGLAEQHNQSFADNPLSGNDLDRYETLAINSLADQKKIEAQEEPSFEDYLASFYQQY